MSKISKNLFPVLLLVLCLVLVITARAQFAIPIPSYASNPSTQPSPTPTRSQTKPPTPKVYRYRQPMAEPRPLRLTPPPTQSVADLPSLRALADQRNFHIGTAVGSQQLQADPQYLKTVLREFNTITPDEEMKMSAIWPERYRFDFTKADKVVNFAVENGLKIRGHTLVWHESIPDWLLRGKYTREEAKDLLKTYIQTVVGHYRGKVYAWDVLNETIFWPTLWEQLIGPEYAELALTWAHEADPDALLFYNDYDIEAIGRRSDKVYEYLKTLIQKGAPIHGVGFQMHFGVIGLSSPDPTSVAQNIARLNELGLQVQITEMDVLHANFIPNTTDDQARIYYDMLKVCLEAKNCTAFVMWGFTDKYSWYRDYFKQIWACPSIYDDRYKPKLAYFGLMKAFRDQ